VTANGPRFLDEAAQPPTATPKTIQPAEDTHRPEPHRGPVLLEAEPDAPSALQPAWEPEEVAPRPRSGVANVAWMALGIAGLIVSWVVFSCITFVLEMGSHSAALGIVATLAFAGGFGLLAYGLAAEWRSYRTLQMVDATRVAVGSSELPPDAARTAALAWLRQVGGRIAEPDAVERALLAAGTQAEMVHILRDRVAEPLKVAALQIGRRAALDGGSLIAISPHASWDGLIAGARGLVVIRQVAGLYGLRPGAAVTVMLMRKVAWTAAGTAGLDLLSQSLADHALGALPVARHLAGILPGTSLAAMRLYRLAGIAAEACCPVPLGQRRN
jgi:putative membrane protein